MVETKTKTKYIISGRKVKSTQMPDLSNDFTPEQLAKAITSKRTGMKLKLADVSTALSISKPTLIKIEKGDTKVSFGNIMKVMKYLGLSFSIISDDLNNTGGSDGNWF